MAKYDFNKLLESWPMKGFPDVWVNPTLLILKPAERLAGREVRDLSGSVAGSYNLIVRINVGQVNTENVFVLQLYICLGWYFYFCSCSVRVRKTRVSVRGRTSNFPRKNTRFCVTKTAGSVSRRPSKLWMFHQEVHWKGENVMDGSSVICSNI